MRTGLLLGVLCLPACATIAPPPVNLNAPILWVRADLPDEAQLCVIWPRFSALVPPYGCITVGELRVILRGRTVARLEVHQ